MSEEKRVELMPADPTEKPKKTKKTKPTLRFSLTLCETTEKTCPEFSYVDLIRKALGPVKESQKNDKADPKDKDKFNKSFDPFGDPLDSFIDEDHGKLEALAKSFEQKYGAPTKKKRRPENPGDLVNLGEGYDVADPFIDDSEAYDEIVPQSLDTAKGGFYINSGRLDFRQFSEDVNSDDDFYKTKKKKKVKKIQSESESESETVKKIKKKAKNKHKIKHGPKLKNSKSKLTKRIQFKNNTIEATVETSDNSHQHNKSKNTTEISSLEKPNSSLDHIKGNSTKKGQDSNESITPAPVEERNSFNREYMTFLGYPVSPYSTEEELNVDTLFTNYESNIEKQIKDTELNRNPGRRDQDVPLKHWTSSNEESISSAGSLFNECLAEATRLVPAYSDCESNTNNQILRTDAVTPASPILKPPSDAFQREKSHQTDKEISDRMLVEDSNVVKERSDVPSKMRRHSRYKAMEKIKQMITDLNDEDNSNSTSTLSNMTDNLDPDKHQKWKKHKIHKRSHSRVSVTVETSSQNADMEDEALQHRIETESPEEDKAVEGRPHNPPSFDIEIIVDGDNTQTKDRSKCTVTSKIRAVVSSYCEVSC